MRFFSPSDQPKTLRTLGAFLCCSGFATSAALAQTVPATPPAIAATSPGLRTLDLNREAALRVPISFEARQRALREVLANLQQQSGVSLSARDETAISGFKVTAHVEAMPLAQMLQSLARLYGFEWEKRGQGYAFVAPKSASLDRVLLQLGALDSIEEGAHLQSWRERRGVNWLNQIAPFASETELRATGGVALTALAPELQTRLRHPIELPAAVRLAQAYAKAVPHVLDANKLRITVQASGKTARGDKFATSTLLNLVNSAGKPVAPVVRVASVESAAP